MDDQVFEKRKGRKEERKERECGREGRKGDCKTIMMMQEWLCKKMKRKRKKEGMGGRRRRRRKTNEYQKIKQTLWHIVELLIVFGTLKIRLKKANMKWR